MTLRAIERDDLPRIQAFNNDVAVELAGGGVNFAIEADGLIIGFCGLCNVDPLGRTAELGITIGDKAYWGRGYGREAIRLVLDHAFRLQNLRRVFLRVHGRNARAIRAYRACGFVEEGRLRRHVWSDGAYDDLVFMGALRDEFHKTV